MSNTTLVTEIIEARKTTTEQALEIFDQLETINLEFMLGRWQGYGVHTNHPMDGLLETFNWYGKEFVDFDQVHPLLFLNRQNQPIKIDPNPTLMNLSAKLNFPKESWLGTLFRWTLPLVKTEQSKARLRMMEYRGQVTATMMYDYLPIHDHFRRIDENTVLGLMDFKRISQPFFFVLKRD
ncbi:DUF4334 domain-containing protein [Euhalothece natronophila Z-M001]|uniref:DUF4334 domain-containing protein n=1 Tax=Euhalothece natronophila Z-M001 TaxID=522448 RepID=A0A5B8NLH6_9CHRO|nr:DUF4334 domain-containing protein [Euhalothece natronophila]QDZ39777.1 DUF4334 domain-containing protein [Euhalothece natronophila Z-M001]